MKKKEIKKTNYLKFSFLRKLKLKYFLYTFIIIVLLIIIKFKWFGSGNDNVIKISYTNDLAGFIFKEIEDTKSNELNFKEYEFMDLGDCCGSATQFAFATNQIDMAILCKDAIKYLNEVGNNNYITLGNIIFDSDILISEKTKSQIKKVGYMNRRDSQKDLLYSHFGDSVLYIPMSPLSLGYALKSGAIDAAYVDMSTYLQLNYDGVTLSEGTATQVIVINKRVKNSKKIKKIIELYNEIIENVNEDDNLFNFLSKYLQLNNKDEVLAKWKIQKIKFGMLKQED